MSRPLLPIDSDVQLYDQNQDCPEHDAAVAFVTGCADRDDVAICELVLLELYQLLRNPVVVTGSGFSGFSCVVTVSARF